MMKRGFFILIFVLGLFAGASVTPPPAHAQLSDILLAPKTLIDRAIEARSAHPEGLDGNLRATVAGHRHLRR
jgi:hyperosmotically inducible protein